jgi:hypothetical protein
VYGLSSILSSEHRPRLVMMRRSVTVFFIGQAKLLRGRLVAPCRGQPRA